MSQSVTVRPKSVALVLAFLLIFSGGYATGRAGYVAERDTRTTSGVSITKDSAQPKDVDFGLFWDAWKIVDEKYVKEPDEKERVYGAISGMIEGLGDPFSMFMEPAQNEQFSDDISGNFEGIGAQLTMRDNAIVVVEPLGGSPAAQAGLLPNDVVIKIDGKDAPGSLDEAVKLIRGESGTKVTLTIVREGASKEVAITRGEIDVKSVIYTKKDNVGVIQISQFNANTTTQLDAAIAQAKSDKVKGVVVDVRNNPGGLLDQAISITSRFMKPGVVVIERDRNGKEKEERTTEVKTRITEPLVVLVNKGSASASEIFAGALQDAGRAKIVGETSFGKGSVQAIERLKDGSAVRITIAEWLTPKKREINKQGIKPDTEVGLSEEDAKQKRDPQLDKALELLK